MGRGQSSPGGYPGMGPQGYQLLGCDPETKATKVNLQGCKCLQAGFMEKNNGLFRHRETEDEPSPHSTLLLFILQKVGLLPSTQVRY